LVETRLASSREDPKTPRTTATDSATVAPDGGDPRLLEAEANAIRAYVCRASGDLERASQLFREALRLLPSEELLRRAMATGGLAETTMLRGYFLDARPLFAEAYAIALQTGNAYMATVNLSRLAEIQLSLGQLHEAAASYSEIREHLVDRGASAAPAVGHALVGMGDLKREWNDLDAAKQLLQEGIEYGQRTANPRMLVLGWVAMARTRQALGDMDGAVDALQEAEYVWDTFGLTRWWGLPSVSALRARLGLAQGDATAAIGWVQAQGFEEPARLTPGREADYLMLARTLIAQERLQAALELLMHLAALAEETGRTAALIEALVLLARCRQARDQDAQAVDALGRAVALAEPGGYVRLFADEGPSVAGMLNQVAERRIAPAYVQQLLDACAASALGMRRPGTTPTTREEKAPLLEPLSERELDVLELIALGLTNRQIAARLYLSLNTVKVHTRNIYGKLDVHSRTQAVARARLLGALAPQDADRGS
jgi:LuxR family maltose regulon positive regulatory protein